MILQNAGWTGAERGIGDQECEVENENDDAKGVAYEVVNHSCSTGLEVYCPLSESIKSTS